MTEEREQQLKQLLNEAMASLEIRRSGTEISLLPVEVYRTLLQRRWTFYSEDSSSVLDFNPYITNEVTKSKLLDFIRVEFAPFIHEDRIQSGIIFMLGSSGIGYPLDELLEQLLRIAIGRGIKKAISIFDRCTKKAFGSFQDVALLQGITLEKEIQVFEGIRLVPLPHSISDYPHYLTNLSSIDIPTYFCPDGTLLIIDHSISPIFHKPIPTNITVREYSDQINLMLQAKVNSEDFPNFEKADFYKKFCQALSFACNCTVQIALQWQFLAEDELFNLTKKEVSRMTPHHSTGAWGNSIEAGKAQIDEAIRLYDILFKSDSKVGEKLRIPIDRWVKSKTDKDLVDKMIDLGVAFETLYLSDIGETTELSFRFRLHAAWHLGKDKEHRKELLTKFGQIYGCRSRAVHSGKLDEKVKFGGERIPISEFIEKAQDLCRESIMKIMQKGRFPNWNDLILGGAVESEIIALGEDPGGLG